MRQEEGIDEEEPSQDVIEIEMLIVMRTSVRREAV